MFATALAAWIAIEPMITARATKRDDQATKADTEDAA